jgi:hypothetical protein
MIAEPQSALLLIMEITCSQRSPGTAMSNAVNNRQLLQSTFTKSPCLSALQVWVKPQLALQNKSSQYTTPHPPPHPTPWQKFPHFQLSCCKHQPATH